MKNYIIILLIAFLFSCKKEYLPDDIYITTCKECTTTIFENGVITDKQTNFFCGEELLKQEVCNYSYINEYSGLLVEVKTVCVKGNIKN